MLCSQKFAFLTAS